MATARSTTDRATRWLAHDLAVLVDAMGLGVAPDSHAPEPWHFDVAIVGSGYGGAIALDELAGYGNTPGQPLKIALFERGREYLPGMFPSRMSDLAGHVRYSTRGQSGVRGRQTGLFDLRIGPDVGVLVGNGLGGGSLINAGVMEAPLTPVFQDGRWPADIRGDATLTTQLNEMRQKLQARPAPPVARAAAMQRLGGAHPALPVSVTVAQSDEPHRGVKACIGCGDCATGCNFQAKLSVDVSVIAGARARHPAQALQIVTGATVLDFAAMPGGGYELAVWHTDPDLRRRQVRAYRIRARKLVLAAGALGSTELLLRAKEAGLGTSCRVGERFSGNGDTISAVYAMSEPARAVANEDADFAQRHVGPTITHMIDRRTEADLPFAVQDLAIPGPLRRLFEETVATGAALDRLTRCDLRFLGPDVPADDAGIDSARIDRSMVVALIGQDDAQGLLRWAGDTADTQAGTLAVDWPALRMSARLDGYQAALARMAKEGKLQATVVANPAWRPLPPAMDSLFGRIRGPTLTVHPLGGCVMGDDAHDAVVNARGQVFASSAGTAVHEDLVVLDGATIPMALGINPALTIATLARRAIRLLRDTDWGFVALANTPTAAWPPRPVFHRPVMAGQEASTRLALHEQMSAPATMLHQGRRVDCRVELQLQFQPIAVADLVAGHSARRRLTLDAQRSMMRVVAVPTPDPGRIDFAPTRPLPPRPPGATLFEAPLRGTMDVLQHRTTVPCLRNVWALLILLRNRALRDLCAYVSDRLYQWRTRAAPDGPPADGRTGAPATSSGFSLLRMAHRFWLAWKLASHAGARRQIRYRLALGPPAHAADAAPATPPTSGGRGATLLAVKTIGYACAANPLVQLSQARVKTVPSIGGLRVAGPLEVDYVHFARIGVPLVRIASQANQARALIDMGSFALYLLRVLLPLHAWTFRLPDRMRPDDHEAPLPDRPGRNHNPHRHRLPGDIGHATVRSEHDFQMHGAVWACLTRYQPEDVRLRSALPPVLMVHGYSASGTTFAHHLLPHGGLAGALCAAGRDAWVLDLRSSAGMPTSQVGWDFEQMGCQDIPRAIARILELTQATQVDVVAHCMGAAMLSLGLFGDWPASNPPVEPDLAPDARKAMPGRIRRIVFSQVGPAVVMSPTNTARAYLSSWLRHYFRLGAFEFLPRNPGVADDMLDRLLALVPYPRAEFARENPLWPPWKRTPWVGPRHRMDALYGITFQLDGMDDAVLDAIDDFFGPLSLRTVEQVIAFARKRLVTDRSGDSDYMQPDRISAIRDVPVLCLHADNNGLVDYATRGRLMHMLAQAKVSGSSVQLEAMGHQDSLIGARAGKTYAVIRDFLDKAA